GAWWAGAGWEFRCALALVPWAGCPPFPCLHQHAQWFDAVFAAATVLWAIASLRDGRRPRLRAIHGALLAYLAAAALTVTRASLPKLLGMAELSALTVVTADLARRPNLLRAMARVLAASPLAIGAAA